MADVLEPVEQGTVHSKGCDVAFDVYGTSGSPVVLIQGVGVPADGWLPQLGALSARHRCLVFDNRGLGRSRPGGYVDIGQMAVDTLALCDHMDWDRVHLMGHSMGGLIALATALRDRRRIRSLSLLCTFASGKIPLRWSWKMMSIGMRMRIGRRRSRQRAFLELLLSPASLERLVAGGDVALDAEVARLSPLFGHDLSSQPWVTMHQLQAMNLCSDLRPHLLALDGIPTLVLSGAHDPIAPPFASQEIETLIPTARHVQFDDASHGLPIEFADEVNALLLEHLRAADGAGSTSGDHA